MFILKSLVAALALGLVQDTIAAAAAPACCTNKCGKSIQLAKNGKKDCSAFLIKTVVPTRTTTKFKTTTLARTITLSRTATLNKALTVVETVTGTTDITVTTIASETDLSTSTSLATVEETETLTETATAVETEYETTTVPYVLSTANVITVIKRSAKPTKPAYASACDNAAYTRACSCIGIKPKTTTKAAVVKTLYKTRTAYKTHTSYKTVTVNKTNVATKTSQAPAVTQTSVLSLTTYTTIISGTAITATETVTLTESATLTETTVVVATHTADPIPPTCIGKGFAFRVSGTTAAGINGWGMGMINSIGVGIYIRLFSGGASPFVITNNSLQSWYNSDFEYYIKTGTLPAAAAQVWVKSVRSNVSYTWAGTRLDFYLGDGPDFELKATSGDTNYMVTFCRDPVYYEWNLLVYTDVSQLAGKTCANDGLVKATCVL
ncbi:hypothetical protein TWF730_010964 [Orbilia blumenaviensis]|uniref:Uncharacterized protein n=1 Tax=Orbilia blumenaviensis TaxID=1796055 RepID=A0AAV9UK56_9PEZI